MLCLFQRFFKDTTYSKNLNKVNSNVSYTTVNITGDVELSSKMCYHYHNNHIYDFFDFLHFPRVALYFYANLFNPTISRLNFSVRLSPSPLSLLSFFFFAKCRAYAAYSFERRRKSYHIVA